MGRHTKRPYDGERAGSSNAKIIKEMKRGRLKHDSDLEQSRRDQKRRLGELEHAISQHRDPHERAPLYLQYANLAASCPPEVFQPDEVRGIERKSIFYDNEKAGTLANGFSSGARPDQLPLNHTVKLLHKTVFDDARDWYIYILNVAKDQEAIEYPVLTLRALEQCILTFSSRILPQEHLQMEINGQMIRAPFNDNPYITDGNPALLTVRKLLKQQNIGPQDRYSLKRVQDARERIGSNLQITTDQVTYTPKSEPGLHSLAVSYLSLIATN